MQDMPGRHDPRAAAGGTADCIELSAPAPLSERQLELAKSITDHVFDSMQRQLWRSHAIVRAGKYGQLAVQK
jgi:hypothetical protein